MNEPFFLPFSGGGRTPPHAQELTRWLEEVQSNPTRESPTGAKGRPIPKQGLAALLWALPRMDVTGEHALAGYNFFVACLRLAAEETDVTSLDTEESITSKYRDVVHRYNHPSKACIDWFFKWFERFWMRQWNKPLTPKRKIQLLGWWRLMNRIDFLQEDTNLLGQVVFKLSTSKVLAYATQSSVEVEARKSGNRGSQKYDKTILNAMLWMEWIQDLKECNWMNSVEGQWDVMRKSSLSTCQELTRAAGLAFWMVCLNQLFFLENLQGGAGTKSMVEVLVAIKS